MTCLTEKECNCEQNKFMVNVTSSYNSRVETKFDSKKKRTREGKRRNKYDKYGTNKIRVQSFHFFSSVK